MAQQARVCLTGCWLTALLLLATGATAGDPSYYHRQSDWRATLTAARRAIAAQPIQSQPLPDFGIDPFTISAWVKTTTGGTILAKAPPEGVWVPQGKSLFVRGGHLCYDIGWVGVLTSHAGIADGRWHHIAITGPRQYRMFIDGRPDTGGELAALGDVAGNVVKLGWTASNFPAHSGLDGALDEVRIYRRRLDAAEVAGLARRPDEAGADSALVARWTMDGTLADVAGGRDARVSGELPAFVPGRAGRALRLRGNDPVRIALEATDRRTAELWQLLARDFTGPKDAWEIACESTDGIYPDDWHPGDMQAVAGRYRAGVRLASLQQAADAAGHDLSALRAVYYHEREIQRAMIEVGRFDFAAARAALTKRHDPEAAKGVERLDAIRAALPTLVVDVAGPDEAPSKRLLEIAAELRKLRQEAR